MRSIMLHRAIEFLLNLLAFSTVTHGWLLAQIGLNETYTVRHLSTHFSRVFLSIAVESRTFPTLVEAQWPVSYLPMRTIVFPNRRLHANGVHGICEQIQQAHWTQVDSLSRLWVMDAGWPNTTDGGPTCPPKLLVFDLIRNNIEVLRIDCSKYIPLNATDHLIVKLGPKTSSCEIERHIYFIIATVEPHLLAYDILEQTWHRRQLICNKYENVTELFPIKPNDFTFGLGGELLVADGDGMLYSTIGALQLKESGAGGSNSISAHNNDIAGSILLLHRGSLLGPSRGMMTDYLGALFYVVPKFGAVVRCTQIANLTAEGNEIIYITSKNIQQIFFGAEGSVWVLTDRTLKPQDMCFPGLL